MSSFTSSKRRPHFPQADAGDSVAILAYTNHPSTKPPTPPISVDDAPYMNGGFHFPSHIFVAQGGDGILPQKANGYQYPPSISNQYKDKELRLEDRLHPLRSTASSLLGKLRLYHLASDKEDIPFSSQTSSQKPQALSSVSWYINQLLSILKGLQSSDLLKFCVLCFLWYASSAVTNNIGKQILNQFRFPVTLTYIQFGFVAAYCFSGGQLLGMTRIHPPTREIITSTLPLSAFQIVGHVFSSVAISRVPVSFVHTIKALSPLFTVIIYRILFGVTYSSRVYTSLLPLTLGVMLACTFQMTSNAVGLLCALGSCIIFVSQNIFSKKLLFKESNVGERRSSKLDKTNLLFYSSAMAFALMTPLWLYTEGITLLSDASPSPSNGAEPVSALTIAFYFFLNGTTHFLQNVFAFSVLALTSPVTYSIASLVKRIFVIVASIVWFGQVVSFVQWVGIILTFVGLWMYQTAKRDVDRGEEKLLNGNILPMAARKAVDGFNSKK